MVQVKNVRVGMLLISDAALQLAPGEVAEVASLTPEMERAVTTGHLVVVADNTPLTSAPDDIAALQAADAMNRVQTETDAERLKSWLATEKRRSVASAINTRLQELASNTG